MGDVWDVSDSTDWLTTALPALAPVESGLRCQVCKDFYTTPMITSCSHTFCSLCIRRCLAAEGKCPTCRAQEQEVKLRKNWAVQELVDAFQAARPTVIEIARQRKANTTEIPERPHKRKLEDVSAERDNGRPTHMRKTKAQSRSVAASPGDSPMTIDSADDEAEQPPDDGLVSCPMCGKRMKVESVYPHLDRCEQEQDEWKSKSSSKPMNKFSNTINLALQSPRRQSTPQPLERLPKLNYSLLKENALRKKLAELGLSSWGTKSLLGRRHTEWVNLWNANCDSVRPKTKRELLQELDVWERSQGGNALVAYGSANSGSAVMKKDFDGAGWAKSHDTEFQRLIANARRSRATKQAVAERTENDGAHETPLAAQNATADDRDLLEEFVIRDNRDMLGEHFNLMNGGVIQPESRDLGVMPDGVEASSNEPANATSHRDYAEDANLSGQPRIGGSETGPKSKYFRESTLAETFTGTPAETTSYLPGRWSDEDSPGL